MTDFKTRIKNIKDNITPIHITVIVLSAIVATASVAIYQYRRAEKYYTKLENQYLRTAYDLYSYVENIENNLTCGLMVTDAAEMVKVAGEIRSKAEFARSALGQLPSYGETLSKISKFLTQVGDYTNSLSMQYMGGRKITDKEYETIESLASYAASLKKSLLSLESQLESGVLHLDDINEMSPEKFEKENPLFVASVKEVESSFEKIPSLIYSGPFSDHLKNYSPALLEGEKIISKEEAQGKVQNLMGKKFSGEISYIGENAGALPTYNFSIKQNKNSTRNITVEITKQGGAISWFLDSRSPADATISPADAIKNATSFLSRYSFGNPRNTYYETSGNTLIANFASTQDDITLYPDLIKVKVALDNGEILGLECSGYISNHKKRTLPGFKYTDEEVKAKISPKATPSKVAKVLIPTDSGNEIFCYEVVCSYKDKTFLVYLNAETLKQEDVLMAGNGDVSI